MKQVKALIKKYPQSAWFLYFFVYVIWFGLLEEGVGPGYAIVQTTLDRYIPFCEYFVIPYYLWFAYCIGTMLFVLFRRPKEEFHRMMGLLIGGITIWLIICTLWPHGLNLRPRLDPNKNICTYLVALMYQIDTPTNVFPSMHAYASLVMHRALTRNLPEEKPWLIILTGLFMLSVCASTVFIKQHSILDVLGAVTMFMLLEPLAYPKRQVKLCLRRQKV